MSTSQDMLPRDSEIHAIPIEPGEELDKFVSKLCKDIKADLEDREEREKKWKISLDQYKARSEPPDGINPKASKMDTTITRERCIQSKSAVINPIVSSGSVFTVKEKASKYKKDVPVWQSIVDWMVDRAEIIPFLDSDIEQAQIYPCSIAKIVSAEEKRTVKYWKATLDEFGESFEDEDGQTVMEIVEHEFVDSKGYKFVSIPRHDIIFPEHSASVDSARYFSHRYRIPKSEILDDKDNYREDLLEVFGENLERLCSEELSGDEAWREFSQRYDVNVDGSESSDDDPVTKDPQLYETYTKYKGKEAIICVDVVAGKYVYAVHNYHFDYPRGFSTFSWFNDTGDIDGSSLCQLLEPAHKVIRAIVNQQLDSASFALEKLIVGPTNCGLAPYFKNGLRGGYAEVEDPEAVAQLKEFSISDSFTQMPGILQEIKNSVDNVSSVSNASFGNEVASRPTLGGTSAVMEAAKQPLYTQVERYRPHLQRLGEIMFSRYRQENKESILAYISGQTEQNIERATDMIKWPEGYWRDQIAISTKVSSQQMSVIARKQEAMATVQTLPQLLMTMLEIAKETLDPANPMAPIASQALLLYTTSLQTYLEEMGIEEPQLADVSTGVMLAQQMFTQRAQNLEEQGPQPGMGEAIPGGPAGQGPGGNGQAAGQAGMGLGPESFTDPSQAEAV